MLIFAGGIAGADDAAIASQARAVFDTRCVACHSCYNAPCQLDLASREGILRGASKTRVYEGTRLLPVEPTRLFIDAHTTRQWHEDKGFFPVLPATGEPPESSLLGTMIDLKTRDTDYAVDPDDAWVCPANELEENAYRAAGWDGMPYGFPALAPADATAINRWIEADAPATAMRAAPSAKVIEQIAAWETFLNHAATQSRLVARYFYEHLFLAHIAFEGDDQRRFYRLVRSSTAPGSDVEEIATVRPYDPVPGGAFHYRFREIRSTITHKTHLVFPLNPARLERYRRWFLESPWPRADATATAAAGSGYNPFSMFAAIPPAARYRFMLDNARYFVMSFIRGPVCEGQMAVNVIDDHFYVLFYSPEYDLSVKETDYLPAAAELLTLPSVGESDPIESYFARYNAMQQAYTAFRAERYAAQYPLGPADTAVWDGRRADPDAWLTVFRHFDNASVVHGAQGGMPESVWVIDYPIFERIYYLLVAGFNVFGNAFHQASTRLYMDNLRVESEDLFLGFLPPSTRESLRRNWYRGEGAQEKITTDHPLRGLDIESRMRYTTADPKGEWIERMAERLPQSRDVNAVDLNRPTAGAKPGPGVDSVAALEHWLARVTSTPHAFVRALPDAMLLKVDLNGHEHVYSLLRTKAHLNVAFLFEEADRRVPEEDTLRIVRGFVGSYPNHLLTLTAAEIPAFVDLLLQWGDTEAEVRRLFRGYGASRYEPDFWAVYDRFNELLDTALPVEAGVLDLSKYSFH